MVATLRLALVALLFLVHGPAGADSLEQIRARGALKVCLKKEGSTAPAEHNDPAHFQKRDFELELAKLIAERILGDPDKLDIHTYKRSERLPAVADGTVDIGLSMFAVNDVDAQRVDFSTPYYEGGLAIMHRPTVVMEGIADLDRKTIVAMNERSKDPGAELLRIAAAAGLTPEIRRVDRFEDGAKLLASGEVDGMVAAHANLDAYIAAGHAEFVRSPLLTRERFAVAVARGNAELLALVNEVIGALQASGRMQALLRDAGLSGDTR